MMTTTGKTFHSEQEVEQALAGLIEESEWEPLRVSTYEDAGIITRDRGLVVRLEGGVMVEITIMAYQDNGDRKIRLPLAGCGECDCSDPTAAYWVKDECECQCHE